VDHVEVPRVERGVVGLADDAAGRVEDREGLGELGEPLEVVEGRVPAYLPLPDERRAVDGAEGHRVAADVDRVLRVPGLDVELARRLGDLLEHKVRVEEDSVLLDPLPGGPEEVQRAGVHELHADLGHQPSPALVQRGHRVLGEDVVAGHPIAEHDSLLDRAGVGPHHME
jgi:hypothetical protein